MLPLLLSHQMWAQPRWKLRDEGGIIWHLRPGEVHQDHIEMSVRRVSVIVGYSVRENGSPTLTRHIAFPSLRSLPNDTSGTLIYVFADDASPRFFVNGKLAGKEVVTRIHHLGLMTIDTIFGNYGEVGLSRTIFSVHGKSFGH